MSKEKNRFERTRSDSDSRSSEEQISKPEVKDSPKRTWKAVMKFKNAFELKEIFDRQIEALKGKEEFEARIKLTKADGGTVKIDY